MRQLWEHVKRIGRELAGTEKQEYYLGPVMPDYEFDPTYTKRC